jgi:hypothetical protein
MQFHPDWLTGTKKIFVTYTGEPKDVSKLPNNAAVKSMRPSGWGYGPPGNTGYSWWDYCQCLDCCTQDCANKGGQNRNGEICEHPYYMDRYAVNLDSNPPTATFETTLVELACGSSSTHGPGDLLMIGKDFVFSNGDGSQYAEFDPGLPEDACVDPKLPNPQGQFRSVRDDFINGKVVRIPYALLNSPTTLAHTQLKYVSKGFRNPVRMFYHAGQDSLYIGDVGFGDGGTTERIFKQTGVFMRC